MILHINLGTHAGGMYQVCRLRKAPIVGQVFSILSLPRIHCEQPMSVLLREIKEPESDWPLYVVERW